MKTLGILAATALTLPMLDSSAPAEPVGKVRLPVEDGLTVGELLQMAEEVLDIDYFLGASDDLRSTQIPVYGVPEIAPAEFLFFFEKALRSVGIVHVESLSGGSIVHEVASTSSPHGRGITRLKAGAQVVEPERIPDFADRGILVTTSYTTQHIPARNAVNTLQPYFGDNFTDNIRNIDGTNTILMTGFADSIAGILRLVKEVDTAPTVVPGPATTAVTQRIEALEQQVAALRSQLNQRR